jgi:adenylate kinase family enzyme
MPAAAPEDLRGARRVLIYGVTGSGKTTAADRVGEVLELPSHHVDDEIGWLPGWVERPADDQRRLATEMAAEERWVIDSANGTWRDVVAARTQYIVALDYARLVSLSRLARRGLHRVVRREPTCNGNYESWGRLLGKESIIRWHFRSFSRKHATIAAMESAPAGPRVVRLRRQADLDALLACLSVSVDMPQDA